MAVTNAFATLGRLLRRTPLPQADVLEAYAHEVIPVLDRAEWLYQYWLEQSTLFTDSEKLGNVAAIHRWETATMGRSLERVIPPSVLARAHEDVIDALELASRAAQLLSNGSRFHNANAVCEGQAMLSTSRERRLVALRAMRRYLLNLRPAQPAEAAHEGGPEHEGESDASEAAAMPQLTLGGQDGESGLGEPIVSSGDLAPSTADGGDSGADRGAAEPVAYVDPSEEAPAFLSMTPAPPTETPSPQPVANQGAPVATAEPAVSPVEPPSSGAAPPSADSASQAPVSEPPAPAPRAGWGSLFNRPGEPPRA
jgi:hypothetical protein